MTFSREALKRWWDLEAEGRERASRRDEVPRNDALFLEALESSAREVGELLGALESDKWAKMANTLAMIAKSLKLDAFVCKEKGIPRKDCYIPSVNALMTELDEYSEELTGKRCTWLRGRVEKYSLSAVLNDLTACFHRMLEKVAEYAKWIKSEGKCHWLEGETNPKLIEACREWDKVTNYFYYNRGLYEPEDYRALSWLSKGNKAEVRVGDSPGHKTHIDLDRGVLEYHDLDENVCWIMEDLFEDVAGLECEDMERGFRCRNLTEDRLKDVARVLAAATSMDFRLESPENYWPESELELSEYEQIRRLLERI